MADTLETLGMVGTGIKAGAQIGGGFAAKSAAEFEAAQHVRNAGNARAAAQRQSFDTAAKTAQVEGTQMARAAASGAAVASPTIMDIMGETAQRGEYLREADLYKGEVEANRELNAAAAAKAKGKNAAVGSILEGVGTGLTGIAKYRPGLATASTDNDIVTDVDTGETIRAKKKLRFG